MANSTSTSLVLFQPNDPFNAKTNGSISTLLAQGGSTLRSYRTDLQIGTRQQMFADQKSIMSHVLSDWIATNSAGYSSKPA